MKRLLRLCVLFFILADVCGAELLYCLQPKGKRSDFPDRAARTGRSHIVIDEAFDGSAETRWTTAELRRFRGRGAAVLCYLSVGEAEDYREYWKKRWKQHPPRFLLSENPEWKGNYRVRYWDPEWQTVILRMLDRIAAAGFDGVYLDIVDGFEFFEENGKREFCRNPETGRTYREDMIRWILRIADRARSANPRFQIFMQNGEALLADARLRQAVSGIALEDLFSDGARFHPASDVRYRMQYLQPMLQAGKVCFAVEYLPTHRKKQLLDHARKYRIPVLMTDRELTQFGSMAQ